MMRGMRQPDKSGREWLVCPACGNWLAEADRDGVLGWGRSWSPDEYGVLVFKRKKYWPLDGQDPNRMAYLHPAVTSAVCPGRQGRGCGEIVEIV